MASPTRHVSSKSFVMGAMVVAIGWLGCATSNGEPTDDDSLNPTTSGRSTPTPPEEEERPAFEAGIEDDSNTDPTPDGGDTCADNDDPGSSENTAKALPNTSDAQNKAIVQTGILNGPIDVDFYRLSVTDGFGRLLEPDTQIKTTGVEMCVFVKCPSGSTGKVSCKGGGVAKKSDIGTDGCCATGPSGATPNWNCSGLDDSATLYFRIRQTENKCLPYSFSYAF